MSAGTMGPLYRQQWARHRGALAPIAVALFLFEFLITRIAPSPTGQSWISNMMAMVPPQLMALAGDQMAFTTGGILALGYGHPFFLLLLGVWVSRASTGALAGDIGRGTMDLVASRPVPRWHHVVTTFAMVCSGLAVLLVVAWTGTAIGLEIRPLGVLPQRVLLIVVGTFALFAACGGIGVLVAATRREGGQAIAWITAILAGSFVFEYLARLWDPIKPLRPLSLFRYYEPQVIMLSGLAPRNLLVLGGVAVTCLLLAAAVFRWRDL